MYVSGFPANMVFRNRPELRLMKKPLKHLNFSRKSFHGVFSIIFASSTTEMLVGSNDGLMLLGSEMTPVFSNISLVLRTISTCSIVDSLTLIHFRKPAKPQCRIASHGGQCTLRLERSLFGASPSM